MDENLYCQIQYDRIDHLESRRENFSNYVLTICTAILGLTITSPDTVTPGLGFLIFLLGLSLNIISILFIKSTMPYISMHQERAKKVCEYYDEELNQIHNSIEKPKPKLKLYKEYAAKRYNIYIWLHWIIIFFFAITTIYNICNNKKSKESIKVELTDKGNI